MANGFLNMLQAASNSAASNVSAPVDGIAWLLRKAGIPVPQNALGGSDWMAQQGLTAPVQQGAGQVAGETLGLLAPMAAAAKAPEIARGLLAVERNALAPRAAGMVGAERGAIVYHGSPHKFDAFDSSKIGSGEGSQAYGHGLYVADNEAVAKSYQAMANNPARRSAGGGLTSTGRDQAVLDSLIKLNARNFAGGDVQKFAEVLKRRPGAFSKPDEMLARIGEYADNLAPSYLYKADLPDEKIARMLPWDAPLTDAQVAPLSQAAMKQFGSGLSGTSGEHLYKEVVFEFKNAGHPNPTQAATEWLRSNGVPGMRHLDAGSRSSGAGTSNFVVFPGEENALKILERNGQGLLGR